MALYFFAIILPEELSEKITSIKLEISDKYDTVHALKLFPHITLKVPFEFNRELESQLIEGAENLSLNYPAFNLEFNGFGYFDKKHPVFFIRPEYNHGLNLLQKQIIDYMKSVFPFIISGHDRNFNPHVSLAYRDLSPENFVRLKKEFEGQKFEAVCRVEDFHLLMHNRKQWEIVRKFKLKS